MIDPTWARQFAKDWIDSWNSHDLDRIFSHYADDFEMSSPLIVERMKENSGTLKGKAAIRPYWQIGLDAFPPLKFELIDVFVGVGITLYYRRTNGKTAAETLILNTQHQIIKGMAHHSRA
ncbi:MAG: nuclear transport factor 2 family protein [Anaerolineaceae bacterium]|nr:nuclear transport factor 2 family protein [Anaerolineaceae bacterium]